MKNKKKEKQEKRKYKEGSLEKTETDLYKKIVTYYIEVRDIQGKTPENYTSAESIRKYFVSEIFGFSEESAQSHCSEKLEQLKATGKMIGKFITNVEKFFTEIPSLIEQWEAYKKLPQKEKPTTHAKILSHLDKLNEYIEVKKLFDDWKKVIDATLLVEQKPTSDQGEVENSETMSLQKLDKENMRFERETPGESFNFVDYVTFSTWTFFLAQGIGLSLDSGYPKYVMSYSLSFLSKIDNHSAYFQLNNHVTNVTTKGIAKFEAYRNTLYLNSFDNRHCIEINFNWVDKVFGKNLIAQCFLSFMTGKKGKPHENIGTNAIAHCGLGTNIKTMLAEFSYRKRCGSLTKTELDLYYKLQNIDMDFPDSPMIINDLKSIISENPLNAN